MERQREDLRFVWLLGMAACVAFILQQSTLPPSESAAVSGSVADVLARLFGGEDTALGAFILRFVRKLAHFAEFFLLGVFSEGYFARRHTVENTALQLGGGLLVAATDECLQLLTDRGALFADVLLDFSGYLVGVLFAGFVFFPILYCINRKAGADRADQQDV